MLWKYNKFRKLATLGCTSLVFMLNGFLLDVREGWLCCVYILVSLSLLIGTFRRPFERKLPKFHVWILVIQKYNNISFLCIVSCYFMLIFCQYVQITSGSNYSIVQISCLACKAFLDPDCFLCGSIMCCSHSCLILVDCIVRAEIFEICIWK